ncbi:helix-turn-helix domain-containing protein [Novosphingobium soli]|uniref:Helix-turn-helix domain-containing protein n=1 Tax=Novosphingobium soli TaxID=574956 RepID=A0ABV6CSR8_9SPHN
MQRKNTPAVDRTIAPQQGSTRDGQPLSYNRAPAGDLAPWIARLYVTKVSAPADYTLSCGLFSDTAFIRIQLAGDWVAMPPAGEVRATRGAFYFGPNTRRMPISVTGSFVSLGLALRPGAGTALGGPRVQDYVDRVVPSAAVVSPSEVYLALFDPEGSPEDWLQSLEAHWRRKIHLRGGTPPDPVSSAFEEIALRDPSTSVSEAADAIGVDRRKLERVVSRDFGMAPKQVLRRARALDMASHLRGVADSAEGEEMALRYYDESHLIHEFTDLFGMSPRQFVTTPQPILTLALESRQARRLEALKRIEPGQSRPWE